MTLPAAPCERTGMGMAARLSSGWEIPLLALLAFCCVLFFTRHLPFYWHDYDYLTAFERGIDWSAVFDIGRGFFYRPLETMIFSGLHSLFGSDPLGYRLFKALVVAALVIALYVLVRLMSGSRPAAAISSLVLIASPSTVQSAMYFSDFELLAETLILFSLISLVIYRQNGDNRWLAGVFLPVAAACLIKETARIYPVLAALFFTTYEGRAGILRHRKILLFLIMAAVWPNVCGAGGPELFRTASLDRAVRFASRALTGITLPLAAVIGAALLLTWSRIRRYLPGCGKCDERMASAIRFMMIWTILVLPLTALAPLSEWRYLAVLSLPLAGAAGPALMELLGCIAVPGAVRKAGSVLLILLLGFALRQSFAASRSAAGTVGSYVSGLDMVMRFAEGGAGKGRNIYYQSWRSELYSLKGSGKYVNIPADKDPLRYLLQSGARQGDLFLLLPLKELPVGLPVDYVREFVSGPNRFVLYSIH